jgi:hypothetical protein
MNTHPPIVPDTLEFGGIVDGIVSFTKTARDGNENVVVERALEMVQV